EFETARSRTRRAAQSRRHIRQGRISPYRNGKAADTISLQRKATSAYGARHQPGFGDGTLYGKRRRRHTEPPAAVCMPSSRTRQGTGRQVCKRNSLDADEARLSEADRQN